MRCAPGAVSRSADFNPNVVHLNAHNVSMIVVSRAPLAKIAAYKERMGWEVAA